MARSKSSHRWLREHFSDPYVKDSRKDGYRSRAAYKLLELDQKDKLLKTGMIVVDLGAAPGGWSQVAAKKVGANGLVLASDILPLDPIAGVEFIQGDFTADEIFQKLLQAMDGRGADLVISDMAPNMSGITDVDQPKSMYLLELALDFAQRVLKPGGTFVGKVFQGEGFDGLLSESRDHYQKVLTRKPNASRSRSRELYLVAKGMRSKSP